MYICIVCIMTSSTQKTHDAYVRMYVTHPMKTDCVQTTFLLTDTNAGSNKLPMICNVQHFCMRHTTRGMKYNFSWKYVRTYIMCFALIKSVHVQALKTAQIQSMCLPGFNRHINTVETYHKEFSQWISAYSEKFM